MKLVFNDPQYSFELIRALGCAPYGGADLGECLKTAESITENDDESWYSNWRALAERIHGIADRCREEGHTVSAREAYLRASNYYRTAEFFLHENPSDPRMLDTYRMSRDTFREAAGLFYPPLEPVRIPYEDTYLPGYFMKASDSGEPAPTMIVQTGFDGTLEELYFQGGEQSVKRGMNCLIFEGPGQGSLIRERNIPFRPDWEKVITPVVDYLFTRPDVDKKKLALLGWSLGGYMVTRAVAFEHRIALCIPNGGIYDFFESVAHSARMSSEQLLQYLEESPEDMDRETYQRMKSSSALRWQVNDGMWKFAAESPSRWMLKTRDYNVRDCVGNIRCHMVVVDSEKEQFFRGQARKLFDSLSCSKEFMLFTDEEGAGEHCQIGAGAISGQRIFDRVEEFFAAV